MPVVRLPGALREYTGGADELHSSGNTVGEVIAEVIRRHGALRRHLFDDAGRLRGFVNLYVNEEDVRHLQGEDTPVKEQDLVSIVPSVAGGEAVELTRAEMGRYSRHIALPEVGLDGQRRLKAARVLIVGAGGLGAPSSLYLAAAGIGTIGLIDFDVVDVTNLQRQVIYREDDVGQSKTAAAARELKRLNPHVQVNVHEVRLTREVALDIIEQYDIVIDGTDNFSTRYLVNDACVLLGKPYVYGSILRFDGQVSVFDARVGPCYRCLFREPPPPGLVPNCAEGGVLGVLPGLIGSAQALEAIKLALGVEGTLTGRLLLFDALKFHWRELKLRKDPDCPICGEQPTITGLIDYDEFCGVKPMQQNDDVLPELTVTELKERLDRGDTLCLVDVRESFEWDIANLEEYGAVLMPLGLFSENSEELDPNEEIVVYCRSGGRSARAAEYLRSQGFKRVWNLTGGITAWSEQVDSSKQRY